jgi:hypothetical protein
VVYFPSDLGSHEISMPKEGDRAPEASGCSAAKMKYVPTL